MVRGGFIEFAEISHGPKRESKYNFMQAVTPNLDLLILGVLSGRVLEQVVCF